MLVPTHTSIGIGDAVKAITTPVIEVHISNTFGRESFRHQSYISGNLYWFNQLLQPFTNLLIEDQYFKYSPVTHGKVDKMTLKLLNKKNTQLPIGSLIYSDEHQLVFKYIYATDAEQPIESKLFQELVGLLNSIIEDSSTIFNQYGEDDLKGYLS